ncbi:1-deoxy-11-beta-hydroxypentalenate dehydrogenase [bacterium MnTg02]|nr:1-deoxy-11-beta-hydroxypentalenate dehydrogenase [bacterium MnTg02]
MSHPVLTAGRTAIVTGAAMGIGLAACKRFAALGMNVCMADIDRNELEMAAEAVKEVAANGSANILAIPTDVSKLADIEALRDAAYDTYGEVGVLMNNAVTRIGRGIWADLDEWRTAMDVNFWGAVYGVRAFVPRMKKQSLASLVINSGSKQGMTNPPGHPIYNVTKSALKTFTEALQHDLRNSEGCRVTAHLLVPGWTTTGKKEHKQGAWLPDQVIDYLLAALERREFYIVCPDGDVTEEMDRQRILWSAGDITERRPPLSRWHPDFTAEFEKFAKPKS